MHTKEECIQEDLFIGWGISMKHTLSQFKQVQAVISFNVIMPLTTALLIVLGC